MKLSEAIESLKEGPFDFLKDRRARLVLKRKDIFIEVPWDDALYGDWSVGFDASPELAEAAKTLITGLKPGETISVGLDDD